MAPNFAWANPTGEAVTHGQATFERSGNHLIIHQGTDKLITKWGTFSIAQGEKTQFIQPTSQSAALNRVVGGSRSIIDGELSANGKVILINPAGVTVGPTGVVNVNSFTASTHDLTDEEFIGGGDFLYQGTSQETVENHGTIRASGGDAILIAKHVTNNGNLEAPNGTAALVGGMEVLVKPTGEERIFIKPGSEKGSTVTQTAAGRIAAASAEVKAAGNPYAAAINLDGFLSAAGPAGKVKVDAGSGGTKVAGLIKARNSNGNGGTITIENRESNSGASDPLSSPIEISGVLDAAGDSGNGGLIQLYGTDLTLLAGSTLNASGPLAGGSIRVEAGNLLRGEGTILAQGGTTTGGMIELYGKTIELLSTSTADASSAGTNGGQIYVGGGYQGKDATKPNADNVFIAQGARLLANAGTHGLGGQVIVWGNQNTLFYGSIEAQGGTVSGDGGFAEVSSPGQLAYRGTTNLRAANGKFGALLLDPTSVVIISQDTITINDPTFAIYNNPGITTGMDFTVPPNWNAIPSGATPFTSYLMTEDLVAALNNASVIVQTSALNVGNNAVALPNLNALTGNSRSGTIYVADEINWDGTGFPGGPTRLTLSAHNDIVIAASILNQSGGGVTLTADSDLDGNGAIFVGTGGLILSNGVDPDFQTHTKNVSIEALDAINVTGQQVIVFGSSVQASARIGNGGTVGTVTAMGANAKINVTALGGNFGGSTLVNTSIPDAANRGSIILLGGTDKNSEAQIGHGGAGNTLVADGGGVTATDADITINALNGGLSLIGHGGSYAQIGHGGLSTTVQGSLTGNILVNSGSIGSTNGGRVILHGATGGDDGYAQIGHGGLNGAWAGGVSGNIEVRVANGNSTGLELYGGIGGSYAQIGHGGAGLIAGTAIGTTAQNWSGNVGVSIALTDLITNPVGIQIGLPDPALAGTNAYAQIGHGGANFQAYVLNHFGGDIGVGLSGTDPDPANRTRMIVTGSAGVRAYSQIGHGGANAIVTSNNTLGGEIGLTLGDRVDFLRLEGNRNGVTEFLTSYAQIGHGGAASNFTAGNLPNANLTVKVDEGRINLLGGYAFDSYAQIGHGGRSAQLTTGTGDDLANIDMNVSQTVEVIEGYFNTVTLPFIPTGSYAQIGHQFDWTKTGDGDITANVNVAAGTGPGAKGSTDLIIGYYFDRFTSDDQGSGSLAQIGHKVGFNFGGIGNYTAGITAGTANGDLYIGRSDVSAIHQIGHSNGISNRVEVVVPIVVSVQGEVLIWGSTSLLGADAHSLIGHLDSIEGTNVDASVAVNILNGGAATKTHRIMGGTSDGFGNSFGTIGNVGKNLSAITNLNASVSFAANPLQRNDLILGGTHVGVGSAGISQIGNYVFNDLTTGTGTANLGVNVSATSLQMLSGNAANSLISIGNLTDNLTGNGAINLDVSAILTNGVTMTAGTGGFIEAVSIGNDSALRNSTITLNAGSTFSAAVNVNAGNGALTMTAGTGDSSLVQIGNGWRNLTADSDTFNLGIDVAAVGSITLTAGSGEAAYALIGHAGYVNSTAAPAPGPIWRHTNATLGADLTVNVTSTAGNLSLTSGSSANASTQIGHAFAGNSGARGELSFSNLLTVVQAGISATAITGTVTLDAKNAAAALGAAPPSVQIGHGGTSAHLNFDASLVGSILVVAGLGISSQAENSYVQIGHGGGGSQVEFRPDTNANPLDKAILVRTFAGDINLQALPGGAAYIQIGHGGEAQTATKGSLLSGNITVQADAGSVIATAASPFLGVAGFVKFGHGGEFLPTPVVAPFTYSGTIALTAGSDLTLTSSVQGRMHVGHASFFAAPVLNNLVGNSDISLLAGRDISIASDASTHARGSTFVTHMGELVDPLTGSDNLSVVAGRDIRIATLNGTLGSVAVLSLGGNTQLTAGRNVSLDASGGLDSRNIISAENLLTVVVDSLSGSAVGPGAFSMASGAELGLDAFAFNSTIEELRIYTSSRALNTIQTGATFWVQGASYTFLAGPETGVTNPNGNWTYRPLYDSAQREQWNTVWNGTLNGGGTFTSPFTVFYKDNTPLPEPPIAPTAPVLPILAPPSNSISFTSAGSTPGAVTTPFTGLGQLLSQEFLAPAEYEGEAEKYYKRKNFQIRVRAKAFAEAIQPMGFTLGEYDILSTVKKSSRFSIERGSFISEAFSSRQNFEFIAR